MVLSNCGHSHENEDKSLTDAAQHLHEILYGGVGLLRDILLHVLVHGHSTRCNPEGAKSTLNSDSSLIFSLEFMHPVLTTDVKIAEGC